MTTPSSSATTIAAPLSLPITEKLHKGNFPLWKAQVMPAIRGAQLEGFIFGTEPAPPKEVDIIVDSKPVKKINEEYAKWIARDQQVVSYLLTSLTTEILTQVADKNSAAELWTGITEMYASRTRARSVNTRIALTTTKKGDMSMSEYFNKMKTLTSDMAAAGKPLDEEEIVSYILAGLDYEYNSVVSAVVARVEPITVNELYTQLVSFDHRQEMLQLGQASANAASRGRGGGRGFPRGRGGYNQGRGGQTNHSNFNQGRGGGSGRGGPGGHRGGYNQGNRPPKPKCQVCGKGHTALECWYRFDPDGRLYISRDVVFDENIFPFTDLQPNAGPRLRSEVLLLPHSLQPATGIITAPDHVITNPTYASNPSYDNAENLESIDAATEPGDAHPVSPHDGTVTEVDLPAATTSTTAASSSGTDAYPGAAPNSSARQPATAIGSPSARVSPPPSTRSAASGPPGEHGTSPGRAPTSSAEPAAVESSADEQPVADQVAPDEERPHTRSKSGIHKPKQYTDGTVRYNFLATADEPHDLHAALSNVNWKHAMDSTFARVLRVSLRSLHVPFTPPTPPQSQHPATDMHAPTPTVTTPYFEAGAKKSESIND
ncbi:Unknown protein [Striga hermonthica]|uniref:Uncharacterized protein n=1 Tax=Striga hermonthica TaxID=68872 RepID=A0A9N7RPW8_STRHE|nr:Unknown protein [Striga hermonthica]